METGRPGPAYCRVAGCSHGQNPFPHAEEPEAFLFAGGDRVESAPVVMDAQVELGIAIPQGASASSLPGLLVSTRTDFTPR